MVGDSVMRYQYLTLAHFLARKGHQGRYHAQKGVPNLAAAYEWNGWEDFMENVTKLLNSGVDADASESCDCQRTEKQDLKTVREYRHLRVCLGGEELCGGAADPEAKWAHTVQLRYHQAFGFPTWTEALAEGVWAVLTDPSDLHPPDVVIMNTAFWLFLENDGFTREQLREDLTEMFANVTALVKEHGLHTKLVWREVTYSPFNTDLFAAVNEVALEVAREYKVDVYDVRSPGYAAVGQGMKPEEVVWDSKYHMWAYMYQEFDDLLLNSLCTPQCKWAQGSGGVHHGDASVQH